MWGRRDKFYIIILFALFVFCSQVFADQWFVLSLDYTSTRECAIEFWQPNTSSTFSNSTVDVTSKVNKTTSAFASLGLNFSGSTIITVDLGWTPFYSWNRTQDSYTLNLNSKCDYTLGLETKGTASDYCWNDSEAQSEVAFMNGYQVDFKRKRLIEQKDPSQLGTNTNSNSKRAIADLYISDLQIETLETGEYVSFLMCFITVD